MPGMAQLWLSEDELGLLRYGLGCLDDEAWVMPEEVAPLQARLEAALKDVSCDVRP